MLAAIKKFILSVMVWFVKRLQDFGTLCLFGTEKITTARSFYSIADKLIDGKTDVSMSQYKGNVVVVTNVASQWGLTKKSYTQFNQLADDYGKGEKGLKILAFPCNQFGGQEPGSAKEILDFVEKFGVQDKLTFFKKGDVNGEKTREVFSFSNASFQMKKTVLAIFVGILPSSCSTVKVNLSNGMVLQHLHLPWRKILKSS